MSAPQLRLVGDDDDRRARAVQSFLGRYAKRSSRRTMESSLRAIMALFPGVAQDLVMFEWECASDPDLYDKVVAELQRKYRPATVGKHLAALRELLGVLAREGLVDQGRLSTLSVDKRKSGKHVGDKGADAPADADKEELRALSDGELRSMLAVCRHDPNAARGARDAAVLAVLASTGARRAEAASLAMPDLVDCTVTFRVKGGGDRTAALHPIAVEYIEHWLSFGATGPRLFCQIRKNGLLIDEKGLGEKSIWRIVVSRRDQAGLDPGITPHSFRRWFVTSLLDRDVDLFTVSRVVGHARLETTQRYDKRGEEVLREAVLKLQIPTMEELDEQPPDDG